MNLSRTVARNTFVQILGKAGAVVFGMATTFLLTNYLGVKGFGQYVFVLSYATIFYALSDWGTSIVGVKLASEKEEEQEIIFGNLFWMRFCFSLFSVLISLFLFFLLPIFDQETRPLFIFSSLLIVLFGFKNSLSIVFQTKLKMGKTALMETLTGFLVLIFSLFFIKISLGTTSFLTAVILANAVSLVIGFFMAKKLTTFIIRPSKEILSGIFQQALPMGGVLVIFSIYNKLDAVLLQSLKGSLAVGVYGLSYRIYEVLVLGAFYLMNSFLPILSKEKDKRAFLILYKNLFKVLFLGGMAVFIGTLIFAPLAIQIIAWRKLSDFQNSVLLLRILGFALFFSYLNHLTGSAILILGKQKVYLLITLAALFFNLAANLFFIPRYSFFASAWITVATEALVFVLTSLLIVRVFRGSNFLKEKKTL